MKDTKPIIKNRFVFFLAIAGLICVTISPILLYLGGSDPRVITTTLVRSTSLSFRDGGRCFKVPIKENIQVEFCKMPPLLKNSYSFFYSPPKFEPNWSDVLSCIVMDIRNRMGIIGCYNPPIIFRLAHNSLILIKHRLPYRTEEAILAVKVYQKYRKEQILGYYLNQLYFGQGVFGYGAAAQHYFGKPLIELEPHQIALLGGLANTYYNRYMEERARQFLKTKVLKKFRDRALDTMTRSNLISPGEAELYKRKPLDIIIKLED